MLTLIEQSYVEVGRQLAEHWNFPVPVKEAICHHLHFSYQLAHDPSKGAPITCLARHLATYHIDAVALSPEAVKVLPVASFLQIPPDAIKVILASKTSIQGHIDSLQI